MLFSVITFLNTTGATPKPETNMLFAIIRYNLIKFDYKLFKINRYPVATCQGAQGRELSYHFWCQVCKSYIHYNPPKIHRFTYIFIHMHIFIVSLHPHV